jgi:hypothetical protein
MNFEESIQEYSEEPLTRQIILGMLKDYKRPNDKINELVKQGKLITLKNGLYIPGAKSRVVKPEPFLIANFLRGPSYVSLESALSHWRLIPERTYEITSITMKASKTYKTPIGRFSYFHIPLPYYSFGIRSVPLTERQVILIASAEKAICDKIILTSGVLLRSTRQTREFLLDDLRIDEDMLERLDIHEISSWMENAPKKESLNMLVKTLSSL